MPRIVRRTPTEPTKFVIDGKEQWFCKCGLSQNQPYCDGSHKLTKGEEPGKLTGTTMPALATRCARPIRASAPIEDGH